ncbi:MAG TPA: PQQ-binding-like beta-propeller repeat protein [Vicinamibacterales bacterium]|jgi:quinoprotein glucose dehydrogenase|nr:PQQ-binding-like beta-propeller repeat protein [Vicinamibacterales bacterium]
MSQVVRRSIALAPLAALVLLAGLTIVASTRESRGQSKTGNVVSEGTANGQWPSYTGDIRGTRYSPLDQINASNFNDLEVAWRFKTDSLGTRPEFKLEGTPLMIGRTLYTTAGTRRAVIALDATTGELLWVHRYPEGARGAAAPRQLSGRGLAYWSDGKGDDRIIYVTPGYRLIALDAKTGNFVRTFGKDGVVDMKVGVVFGTGQQIDLETGEIGLHSTPLVVKDLILVGSAMKEGMTVTTHNNTKGVARAYDARTGKELWTFNGIPRPGEFGNDTWLDNSWAINGNTGVWTQITVDEELGLAYLPVETPTSDYYGGKRPGNNLFAESLVCVDLQTGNRKWYFQFVHHPIWDHDMSSAPLIADVTINGKPRKVVAVPSKQAWLYVFDRVTGEPIWPIVEKAVPKGDVPGEWYAPTQPHPPDALMYGRNALNGHDDLIDFTPELRAQAIKNLERYKWYPAVVYNPPIVGNVKGLLGGINIGNASGGTNWPGGGYDPETHIVYAQAGTSAIVGESVAPPPEGFSDLPYQAGVVGQAFRLREAAGTGTYADVPSKKAEPEPTPAPAASGAAAPRREGEGSRLTVEGLSILKPPYGVLSAIDLDQGKVLWKVPHGDTPDIVRNHPKLQGLKIPKTGQGGSVGLVITKTLVILGDPQATTMPDRPRGAMLRAYDKKTGQEVGAVYMPAIQSGSPMTYMVDKRQYIVVAVSGGPYSGEYIAFSLPADQLPTSEAVRK